MTDKKVRPMQGARVRVLPLSLDDDDALGLDDWLDTAGKTGTVVGRDGAWLEVVLDGDTTPYLYLGEELAPEEEA